MPQAINLNRPSSTDDLRKTLRQLGLRQVRVISKDDIQPNFLGSCILNIDKRSGPGTHWTAIYDWDGDKGIYFDPYGVVMPQSVETLAEPGLMYYSGRCIQRMGDQCCGYFCIAFLHAMHSGMNFGDFLDMFNSNGEGERHGNVRILRDYLESAKLQV